MIYKLVHESTTSKIKLDKAISFVQKAYCNQHIGGMSYLLIGDVADLIKIFTNKEIDITTLTKYE